MMFGGYYGSIRIGDGMRDTWTGADTIRCREKDGTIQLIKTRNYGVDGKMIAEYKRTRNNKILEWFRFGAFSRIYSKPGIVELRFHPKSLRTMHGISLRTDQALFGTKGRCRTEYSHGRFVWQDFRYKNHKLAYSFRHTDKKVTIKYPNGNIAAVIECPVKGFSTRSGDPDRRYSGDDTATCYQGHIYFQIDGKPERDIDGRFSEKRSADFSKDGNSKFIIYNTTGKVKHLGEYHNRQRTGQWIINGVSSFFIHGVAVSKKLWNTPPEKLSIRKVLKLKNAQLRAILLARIGPERISKQYKYKTIHQTKDGMKLMEFPILLDDGNGGRNSKLRILQVTCPSTKTKYYLNVPDFVWDGGKRTKLDTCEAARQWTFGVDDPRKRIKFAVET